MFVVGVRYRYKFSRGSFFAFKKFIELMISVYYE